MSAISIALPTDPEDGLSTIQATSLTPSLESDYKLEGTSGHSDAAHAYGLEASLIDPDRAAETLAKPGGDIISPAEKLQVLSLATILLDLPAKEGRSSEVDTFAPHVSFAEQDLQSSENALSQPETFLRIELAKGSSELPSIQNVTHVGEQADIVMPVSLAVLQPFLDHAVKIHVDGQSAIDVLQPLTLDGTVNATSLGEFKSEMNVSLSAETGSHVGGISKENVSLTLLPTQGWVSAADTPSITSAIEKFVRAEGYGMAFHNHDVIFYEPQAVGGAIPDPTVSSVTWEFRDGSSITLVGHLGSHLHLDPIA